MVLLVGTAESLTGQRRSRFYSVVMFKGQANVRQKPDPVRSGHCPLTQMINTGAANSMPTGSGDRMHSIISTCKGRLCALVAYKGNGLGRSRGLGMALGLWAVVKGAGPGVTA